jgi:hypothetical protein
MNLSSQINSYNLTCERLVWLWLFVSAEARLAQRALDWLLRNWPEPAISLPDLYQRGPGAIRDNKTARQIVSNLEDHGWLVRLKQGAVVAGVHRRDAWRIVRG